MAEWLTYLRDVSEGIIGAAVGFWLVTIWDRHKDVMSDKKRLAKMLESMVMEIGTLIDAVSVPAASFEPSESVHGAITAELSVPFLPSAAFEAAVHSGNLTLLSPQLQSQASSVYEAVRLAKLHVDNIATSYTTGMDPEPLRVYLENAYGYLRGNGEMLANELRDLKTALEAVTP